MNKTTFLLIAVLALCLAGCSNNNSTSSFKATGNTEAEYVYYTNCYFNSGNFTDSVKVTDGKFTIEDSIIGGAGSVAIATDGTNLWLFVTNDGDIQLLEDSKVGGSETNIELQKFFDELDTKQEDADRETLARDFMARHNGDAAAAAALIYLQENVSAKFLKELFGKCSSEVQEYVGKVISEEYLNSADIQEATSEGKTFVDFEATYDGKTQKLSDYVGKGKFVLVDFWASWCGPCRGEIPNIKSVFEKYGGENFTVVGVATWDKPEDTMKAIGEEGISYPQIINAQTAGSDAYGIVGIPEIILFSPDGIILRRGLRGENIEIAVKEALGIQ